MVTRRVIRISPKEAEALKPAPPAEASSSVAVAVVDSLNNNNGTITKNQSKKTKPETLLCNHPSCTKHVQQPSQLCWKHHAQAQNVICKFTGCKKKGILLGLCPDHGGLVQLCQWRGCINVANLEKRGGLCWMHRARGRHDDDSSDDDKEAMEIIRLCRSRGCISRATTDDGLCDRHSTHDNEGVKRKKKRAHAPGYSINDNVAKKRQRVNAFAIDLTDVPPQPHILKSASHFTAGASKFTGVSFHKSRNTWQATISIDGKQSHIGYYKNEEEAAADYARAVFKYKRNDSSQPPQNSFILDLEDVPPQPLILKNDLSRSKEYSDNTRRRNVKKGSSKYTGVYFAKDVNKWKAQIMIDGTVRSIGYYEIEEEAAADYARAVFKYKPKKSVTTYGGMDLKDIPDQPLIHSDTNKSGFKGVKKNKSRWEAALNAKSLGTFDTKEEAAGIYARARYYVEREGEELSTKKNAQKSVAIVPEESFDLVAV